MSLCINATTPEGIVLAGDSRQSYRNKKGMSRIGSDSASKIFQLTERVGVAAAGLAFLPEGKIPKNISGFIEDFKLTHDLRKQTVENISNMLKKYFEGKYDYKPKLEDAVKRVKANLVAQNCKLIELDEKEDHIIFKFRDSQGIEKSGMVAVDQLQLIVAGFNLDDSHQVAVIYIPGNLEIKRDSKKRGSEYGASWIGQTDVVSRIVLGFDGRIGNLPFMQKAVKEKKDQSQIKKELTNLEYAIQWGTMTLQDGIDFSRLAIETTSAIQRFSDGIKGDPGGMLGVGGPIDVSVITPKKGFVWISKKRLASGKDSVDLEKHS